MAAGTRRAGDARRADRPAVHHRGRRVQPRAQPRPAGVQRRLLRAHAHPARPVAGARARRGRGRRTAHRADRHAADHPQARPVARQHGAQPALPGPQRRVARPARRGLLRAAHQGSRRAARAPGLGDGRGVQRQLPGAPAGDAGRVRQRLQHRSGDHRPDARVGHQLAAAVRQATVGRDEDRAVRTVGRHPSARTAHARTLGTGDVRGRLGRLVGRRSLSRGHHPLPAGAVARRQRRSDGRARGRQGAAPRRPAAAHRHGLALEPGLLRHLRDADGRGAAPAHREPRVAVGTEHGRRDRQRGAVARVDAGAPDALPRDQPHDAVRAGARQLRRGRPPRALVDAGVARRRRAPGRRAHVGRARADRRRGAGRDGRRRRRRRALPRRDRAPGALRAHRVAVGPRCRSPRCSTRARVGSASTA